MIKGLNLETMLKIAQKNPNYEIFREKGFTNIIRNVKEKSGKYTSRVQSFDNNGGKLLSTNRIVNDNFSIYTNPTNGLLGLEYFAKVKAPEGSLGFRINPVRVETTYKNIGDIRAFYESQAHNMK